MNIERLVSEGRISRKQRKKAKTTLGTLEREFMDAADSGEDIQMLITRVQLKIEPECDRMTTICPLGDPKKNAFNGLIQEEKWMRVRNGITMDSGCSVFVMPSDWLTKFALKESEGSKSGQTYVAVAKEWQTHSG